MASGGAHERAVMLELRRKDGSKTGFAYAWLEHIDFDPSQGITLIFARATVKIAGCNLNPEKRPHIQLCAGILRHRVPWIEEPNSQQLMEGGNVVTVIEAIVLVHSCTFAMMKRGRTFISATTLSPSV